MTDPRIAGIAARAATLADRLGPDWRSSGVAPDRLERWRERVGGDLATRLGWVGWSEDAVAPRLGEGSFAVLPDWCEFLVAAMQRTGAHFAEADAHPFGPLLSGFADEAVDRLPCAFGDAFTPGAASTLIDDLFTKLSYLAAPVLQIEFVAFRGEPVEAGAKRFEAFVGHMAAGALWDFFAEYAALARLLALCAQQWVAHVGRIAEDFAADRAAIAGRFGGALPERIVAVEPSLSDAHNHGRSVAIVTLSSGLRLAYKPRSVGIEAAWFALLADLDGDAGSFRSLAVLDRGTRGWVEIAAHAQCADPHAYYARAGNLLALLYALEASDCFHENIVAAGDFPVLIDMETLMHHVLRPAGASAADDVLFDSVMRAGLLPVWEAGRDNVVIDISGLGAAAEQTTPYLRRRWGQINRDAMALQHAAITVTSVHHLPMRDGRTWHVADFADDVVVGFQQTYRALIERRDALLAPGGGVAAMGGETLRLVFHPTRLYGLMLKRLGTPKALRSGLERSIEFDVLARFYLGSAVKEPYRALLGAELAALERGDIPYFALRADAVDLPLEGGCVTGAFAQSGIARAAAWIGRLGEADLAVQTEFVRASLAMAVTETPVRPEPVEACPELRREGRVPGTCFDKLSTNGGGGTDHEQAPAVTDAQLIAAARAIGDTLSARAIRSGDGSATWIAPQLLPHSTRYELRPLRLDLYGGQAGVALFLTALAREAGDRKLALAALAPLRRDALPGLGVLLANGHTIGGATGVGGIVYVLTRCADLLEQPELLDDALSAALLLNPSVIAADVEHDVMAGTAGAALGLLALHDATGNAEVLAIARACGDHLLARAVPVPGGIGWASGAHPSTTGLSHGAAGIALALSRLAGATGDARYQDAADRALAFEAWAFDAGRCNWRDLRGGIESPPAFMNAWCHGALGIGLSRIAMQAGAADIAAAVALDRGARTGGKDGLCCGTMARAELRLSAGDPAAARAIAGAVLDSADRRGGYALAGSSGPDLFDPSFFQGLSGIGYQLLRLADPALPRALTWD